MMAAQATTSLRISSISRARWDVVVLAKARPDRLGEGV